jgi:Protein tyrosine and serine/threonine kinase
MSMALAMLVLAERHGVPPPGEGWTARAPDGALLDVWRVGGLEASRRSLWLDELSPLASIRHPNLVPVLAVGEREGGVWVVSELDAGRPLRRLLAVARLTPEQAALVTVGVVEGMQALHQADRWHGRLDERTVHVGAAGQVRLGAWGLGLDGHDREERRARDREGALRLLGRLGRSTGRPPRAADLLRALDACGARDGEEAALLVRAREAAVALLEGGGAGERAAHELAVVVGMLERDPAPQSPSAPQPPPLAPHPLRSPAAVWTPQTHRARWLVAGLSALALVAIFIAVAAWYASSRSVAVVTHPMLSASPPPAPTQRAPTAPPTAGGPRPVPAQGPAAAGPITAIEIQPLQGSCQPGAVCPVQVTVRLQPQPAAQEVRWSFRVFDRCTGATSVVPGASVTALPGWAYVYGTSWPALSASHPIALVAVTETPATAASPAVLAGGSGC